MSVLHPASVLAKTQKGFQELRTGRHELSPRLRALLAMVDGRQTAGHIVERLRALGPVETELGRLLAMGFIEDLTAVADGAGGYLDLSAGTAFELADDAARMQTTKDFVIAAAARLARVRSVGFRRRVRRCTRPEALSLLIDEFHAIVTRARGAALAETLADRARRLMGR